MNFDISLWEFTSILKAITVLFVLHFDSYPAEAIMIWLTKQMNTLSNQSFRGVFVKLSGEKNVGTLLENCQRWIPVLIKLQDNVSKTGFRNRLFPRAFPILEQPFRRATWLQSATLL